ncbi:MAG: Gfo/Idh/MocA family oxidoreductase [Pseudomonadota bacterium]|nr:Gfo/Idh/MocA family oxidoreductase [Pseudomonadota bacterium]
MRRLGIGVIGCGVISDVYCSNIPRFSNLALRAVADMRAEAARAKGEAHGVPAVSVDELLAREDVDIVLNLTVPQAHVEVGLAAIAAGKHVYSEKPLAGSVAEAQRLLEAAEKAGLRIGSAPDTFLGGAHQSARALLDEGRIGTPTAGTATLMLAGHERWHPNPDFYYAGPGAGPLMDMGPYYVTAMVHCLGPVARVFARGAKGRSERVIATGPRAGEAVPVETPTHITGILEFHSGALIQIATSFDVRAHLHTPLELYGTEGSLAIPDPNRFDGTVRLFESEWRDQPTTHAFGDDNWRGLGLADMAAAISEKRPHRANGDLALHVLDVMESALRSVETGQMETLRTDCVRPEPMARETTLTEQDAA